MLRDHLTRPFTCLSCAGPGITCGEDCPGLPFCLCRRYRCAECSQRTRATNVREHERAIGRIYTGCLRRGAPMPARSMAAIESHREAIAAIDGIGNPR